MMDVRGARVIRGGRPVLADLSLHVRRGTLTVLLGPNGAGKTTLLRVLAGLERARAGEARIDGLDPIRDGARVRRLVAFVDHESGLYDELTVCENVRFAASFHRPPDPAAAVLGALHAMGIADVASERTDRLSRGMRQRAVLARALACGTPALLLDEPHTALDPEGRARLRAALRDRRAAGCTIVLASADPDPLGFATMEPASGGGSSPVDRVVGIREGRLAFDDAPPRAGGHYESWMRSGGAP
jgi:heme ABC exporter ATP-binding subunit CcmA